MVSPCPQVLSEKLGASQAFSRKLTRTAILNVTLPCVKFTQQKLNFNGSFSRLCQWPSFHNSDIVWYSWIMLNLYGFANASPPAFFWHICQEAPLFRLDRGVSNSTSSPSGTCRGEWVKWKRSVDWCGVACAIYGKSESASSASSGRSSKSKRKIKQKKTQNVRNIDQLPTRKRKNNTNPNSFGSRAAEEPRLPDWVWWVCLGYFASVDPEVSQTVWPHPLEPTCGMNFNQNCNEACSFNKSDVIWSDMVWSTLQDLVQR